MGLELTAFNAREHGFKFANDFTTIVLPALLLGSTQTQALDGLCGGMSFAALDYFHAGAPVPTHTSADYPGPDHVPARGTRLWEYILRRHLASVGVGVVPLGVPVTLPPLTLTVNVVDTHPAAMFVQLIATPASLLGPTLTAELSKVKQAVLAGTPASIVLVSPAGIAQSHQVVVIGFDDSVGAGIVTLFLYDCRFPGKTSVLTVDTNAATCAQSTPGASPETWKAFFVSNYTAMAPTYQDWGLASGINAQLVAFPGSRVFNVSFTARNFGEVPARAREMTVDIAPDSATSPLEVAGTVGVNGDVTFSFPIEFPSTLAGQDVVVTPGFTDESTGIFSGLPRGFPGTTARVVLTVPVGF